MSETNLQYLTEYFRCSNYSFLYSSLYGEENGSYYSKDLWAEKFHLHNFCTEFLISEKIKVPSMESICHMSAYILDYDLLMVSTK